MNTQYIIAGVLIGLVTGWIIGKWAYSKRIVSERAARFAGKKARQKKILERFRIEVKNNTIRLKKDLKKLKLSKQIESIDILLKNYDKRLYKIADKELLSALKDYYVELHDLNSANEMCLSFIEKNIKPNEKLDDETTALFYNSMAATIIEKMDVLIEKGPVLVTILEGKIEDL